MRSGEALVSMSEDQLRRIFEAGLIKPDEAAGTSPLSPAREQGRLHVAGDRCDDPASTPGICRSGHEFV
jgi:hypothetical protein